jgi:hypothetical protein
LFSAARCALHFLVHRPLKWPFNRARRGMTCDDSAMVAHRRIAERNRNVQGTLRRRRQLCDGCDATSPSWPHRPGDVFSQERKTSIMRVLNCKPSVQTATRHRNHRKVAVLCKNLVFYRTNIAMRHHRKGIAVHRNVGSPAYQAGYGAVSRGFTSYKTVFLFRPVSRMMRQVSSSR